MSLRFVTACGVCLVAVLGAVFRWRDEGTWTGSVKQVHLIISTDLSAGITGPHGGCAHCNPQLVFPLETSEHNFFVNYRPQVKGIVYI